MPPVSLAEIKVGVTYPVAALEVARSELSPAATRQLMLLGETHRRRPRRPRRAAPLAAWLGEEMRRASEMVLRASAAALRGTA